MSEKKEKKRIAAFVFGEDAARVQALPQPVELTYTKSKQDFSFQITAMRDSELTKERLQSRAELKNVLVHLETQSSTESQVKDKTIQRLGLKIANLEYRIQKEKEDNEKRFEKLEQQNRDIQQQNRDIQSRIDKMGWLHQWGKMWEVIRKYIHDASNHENVTKSEIMTRLGLTVDQYKEAKLQYRERCLQCHPPTIDLAAAEAGATKHATFDVTPTFRAYKRMQRLPVPYPQPPAKRARRECFK